MNDDSLLPSTDKRRSFYVAVILHEASVSAPDYRPLYSETFVLIEAGSVEEAREKAQSHGRSDEVRYENQFGETVTWSLRRVVDVNSILDDDLVDGAELYVRHFRNIAAYDALEPPALDES